VPESIPLSFLELLEKVRAVLPSGLTVYAVGGAVRDELLGRPIHDVDFVLSGDVLKIGRRAANALGGAYYPLDEEHDTARVILSQPDGSRLALDFAAQRGPDLESDLRARDFTLNAIAVELRDPQTLLDPLEGGADLRAKLLRACSPTAFEDDPLRILRGVRLATGFGFHIQPETRQLMRQSVERLPRISPERLRDELFRILDGPQPATALRDLDLLGGLLYVLPELLALKGVTQSPPHFEDVWSHTLSVLQKLESVLKTLALPPFDKLRMPNEPEAFDKLRMPNDPEAFDKLRMPNDPEAADKLRMPNDPEAAANLALAPLSLRLGRYREQLHAHLSAPLNPLRSVRALLFMAALYHDIAKPDTRQVEGSGRIRFLEHELVGEQVAARRARVLHLSNDEIERLKKIVHHHMRPLLLAQTGQLPTRRAVYRFYHATGPAGVDVCLLSLADSLATYGPELPQDVWGHQIDVVRTLLEAWWERPDESISPPALIDGHDLMQALNLEPGPEVGRLLELVREAQASGEVHDQKGALAMARASLRDKSDRQ